MNRPKVGPFIKRKFKVDIDQLVADERLSKVRLKDPKDSYQPLLTATEVTPTGRLVQKEGTKPRGSRGK